MYDYSLPSACGLHNFVHPFGHTQAFLNPAFDDVATDLNIQISESSILKLQIPWISFFQHKFKFQHNLFRGGLRAYKLFIVCAYYSAMCMCYVHN